MAGAQIDFQVMDRARRALDAAEALIITAGAGMGVDSGLPDFRGNAGFWKAYPVARKLGLSFIDLANPDHFSANPRLAWAFYGHRLQLYRSTPPHRGFDLLLKAGRSKPGGCFVFTSNVDGHFQRAGFDEERVMECHGSIHRLQCTRCHAAPWPASAFDIDVDMDAFAAIGDLPMCHHCGAMARPNILMFGDHGWTSQVSDRQQARMIDWWRQITAANRRVVIIEIGAGTAIPTVRLQSEQFARYSAATLVRINPRESAVPSGHIGIPLAAGKALDMLCSNS